MFPERTGCRGKSESCKDSVQCEMERPLQREHGAVPCSPNCPGHDGMRAGRMRKMSGRPYSAGGTQATSEKKKPFAARSLASRAAGMLHHGVSMSTRFDPAWLSAPPQPPGDAAPLRSSKPRPQPFSRPSCFPAGSAGRPVSA